MNKSAVMGLPSNPHSCNKMDEFLKIAGFMGEITESVKNVRKDLNVLFGLVRDVNTNIDILKKEYSDNNIGIANKQKDYEVNIKALQIKYAFIGVVGAALFQMGLLLLKNLF